MTISSAGRELAKWSLEGHVATITLNRPEALNAISGQMAAELTGAFRRLGEDSDAWVGILAAAGDKAFCVGADLKERAGFSIEEWYANRSLVREMFAALRAVPQPIVASVFGFALGGGFELALSCDLIVASEGTKLGLPEARVGLLPAGGGTQLLTRKAGPARAKQMIFTGRRIDASEASQWGIVARVVSRSDLDRATRALASEICEASPVAVREAKRAIDAGLGVPIETGVDVEHDSWTRVISSEDRAEGIAAFNEKRIPDWSGK